MWLSKYYLIIYISNFSTAPKLSWSIQWDRLDGLTGPSRWAEMNTANIRLVAKPSTWQLIHGIHVMLDSKWWFPPTAQWISETRTTVIPNEILKANCCLPNVTWIQINQRILNLQINKNHLDIALFIPGFALGSKIDISLMPRESTWNRG